MALSDLIPWYRERGVERSQRREDPFWALQREMNRMFDDFTRGFAVAPWSRWDPEGFSPRIDVRETEQEVVVSAEMPGLEEKDFELTLTENVLTLKGEKRHEHEEKGSIYRVERGYGAFQRSVQLPCEVEAEKAIARYEKGVLSVTLPKAPSAQRRTHHIDVKSG